MIADWHPWPTLTPDTLYDFLRLRSDIFVVEQNCAYADMDGIDPACEHLCMRGPERQLLAYLRLVPPGLKAPQPAIGRLVVAQTARKSGLGRAAMLEGIRRCTERFPSQDIFLSGQLHLEAFYSSLGFVTFTEPYLEDGIQHVNMLKKV
ncbi:MAG: GNAT family N-acetyltransferase [Pseudomonadota bacterium]